MTHYLIEFRFQGRAKSEIKKLVYEVDRKFRLKYVKRKRPVPHATIVAPFYTKNQKRLVRDFIDICNKHPLIRFNLQGYGCFDSSRVVFINIKPSKEMIDFRKDLIKKIKNYSKLVSYDYSKILGIFGRIGEYKPHVTIAMKVEDNKYQKVKNYIEKKKKLNIRYTLARATLIKGNRILYEYDFILRKVLNRSQAKNKKIHTKTIKGLKNN